MANLIYVAKDPAGDGKQPYSVASRLPLPLLNNLPLKDAILLAIIKEHDESLQRGWLELVQWREPLSVGQLEVLVAEASQFETYKPVPSDSRGSGPLDPRSSDALYFGRNDKLGMLLQYLDPSVRRTGNILAHTSVHHHEGGSETYHLLQGAAGIALRDIHTGKEEVVKLLMSGSSASTLTVPIHVQHPVLAWYYAPSIMLIVSNPPNNTKSDHLYAEQPFAELFPKTIASYRQRTRGPSGAAKEAGSQ